MIIYLIKLFDNITQTLLVEDALKEKNIAETEKEGMNVGDTTEDDRDEPPQWLLLFMTI